MRHRAARTSGRRRHRVRRGRGEVRGRLHQIEHYRSKGLQLLVVARSLVTLFEDDRQLPLGQDAVVVDVIDLAKWKLAVVLEQGFQRAGDDEKLQAFGPVVLDLMASAAELAESTPYSVLATS